MGKFFVFLFSLLGGFFLLLVEGFVISKFWLWFVVSKFDVPLLTSMQAGGLLMTFNMFLISVHLKSLYDKKEETTVLEALMKSITTQVITVFACLLTLGLGAIWHSLM